MERTTWRDDVSVTDEHAPDASGSLVLDRYRPLRPLGSGGSGSVWLVRDERSGREVALKIVAREGKAGTRAEREAQAAARLRHPRCPRALALHRDDRHVYAAYEYVEGKTLREALRAGELDDARSVEAAAQVLEALAHAHSKGIVHRDVKPANVMVRSSGSGGRVVGSASRSDASSSEERLSVSLLDFGLAHIGDADTLTAVGDVPGTLAYIAPERLDGERATAAADVWSVGVLLWEALAGWHPFSAPSPVETARRIGAGAQPLARSRPDLPAELCALVDRMLSVDPRRRPVAKRLPDLLRSAGEARDARSSRSRPVASMHERMLAAVLAAAYAGGALWILPFFPRGWPLLVAALVAIASVRSPRVGAAVALAAPILPLGNLSLGLALAYAAFAAALLVLVDRDAEHGLLFASGPVLGLVGALGLAPAIASRSRGVARRAAHGALAVLATAPITYAGEPFAAAGAERPDDAVRAVTDFLAAHPILPLEAAIFGVAAAAAPIAVRHREWGIAVWGALFLATAVLLPAYWTLAVAPLPLVVGVWAAAAALGTELFRARV